jgi:hypothetical protein
MVDAVIGAGLGTRVDGPVLLATDPSGDALSV